MAAERERQTGRAEEQEGGETGMGSEAAEGIHSVNDRAPDDRTGADRARPEDPDAPGSEPLRERTENPKGGYGGEMGEPRG